MEVANKITPSVKTCYKCSKDFNSYLNSNAYSIICPHCGTLYNCYNGVLDKTTDVINKAAKTPEIPIGAEGIIKGISYVVLGYTHKKEKGTTYYWHEYSLFNPIHGPAFLSQFNGHWIYLTEVTGLPVVDGRIATYKSIQYDLYARYQAQTSSARGESIYRFSLSESPVVEEFINPPYMISREKTADNITWYFGEYVQPSEVKNSFKLESVPDKIGTGMIEPYIGKFKSEAFKTVLYILSIFWVLLQFYFLSSAREDAVFEQSFTITDSLNKKEIYTKSFDLKNGTSNAEIKINTNIDNNWMYTAITLVNEKTGDLYDLDLEAEYYHGYTDGENWTEGNSWISKVISQIPEGHYYMIIYPEKPGNMSTVSLTVSVKRDVYIFSNGLIVLILLGLFPTFYFYRKTSFEKNRWYNSNYSPYEDDSDEDTW